MSQTKWMRGTVFAMSLGILLAAMTPQANATPQQMQITLAGYTNRTETLTNFPVLVVLSNNVGGSGFTFANFVTTNGTDLRFVTNATDTSDLNYEIESWNTNAGQASYVWVQASTIPPDGSGVIWVKWGDTANSNQLACTTNGATWDSNYCGVWHLPNGTTLGLNDSTSNGYNLANNGGVATATGQIGGGASSPSSTAWASCGNKGLTFGAGDMLTVEAWVRRSVVSSYCPILSLTAGPSLTKRNFEFDFNGQGVGETTAQSIALHYRNSADNAWTAFWHTTADTDTTAWHHYEASLTFGTAGSIAIYKDGSAVGASSTNGANIPATAGITGIYLFTAGSSEFLNGSGDEVRFSKGISRSSNWVWACYVNQASNTLFNSYGQAGAPSVPVIQNQTVSTVTTTGATFNGYLVSTGTSATAVYVLWGGTNGAVSGSWANTNLWNPGDWTNNSFPSTNIGLTAGQNYYYTFGASNATTNVTASSPQYLITGALTVQATDPTGRSNAFDTATFTVSRPATCTNEALVVNYTLGGTATNFTDYIVAPTSGAAVIAQGQTNCMITVTPVFKIDVAKTVVLTLASGAYAIGSANSDTCTLASPAGTVNV